MQGIMRERTSDRARDRRFGIALAALLTSVAMPAVAQEAPAPAATTPPALQPGEIVVTATRRSEGLQKVPISLQALGNQTLEQHQVQTFDDYVKLLPSVTFNSFGPGQSQVYFRGINSGGDGLDVGSLPTVGTYLNDIPVTTVGNSVDIHLYDISRIEALAGPQGTLFGASSLAGTLRIITNKPDPSHFSAGYDLQVNKFGKGNAGGTAEAFVNIPLAPNAAIRLVGFYQHDGGYIDNTYKERTFQLDDPDPNTKVVANNGKLVGNNQNDIDTWGGRAALKVDLDSDWSITPELLYQRQISHGSFLFDPNAGDLKVHDFFPSFNKDEFIQASLTIQGKIGNWDLTYSGAYFDRLKHQQLDYSYYSVAYDHYSVAGGYAAKGTYYYYTKFPDGHGGYLDPDQTEIVNIHFTKQTHELRLASPTDAPAKITVGAFTQLQLAHDTTDFSVPGLSATGVAIPNAGLQPYVTSDRGWPDAVFFKAVRRADRDYAAFAEGSYDLSDQLTLTAGIRGFKVNNSLYGFSGIAGAARRASCIATDDTYYPCINIYDSAANPAAGKNYRQTGETHKVSLAFKFDPTHMLYATYSTGFRPGGVNRRLGQPSYLADRLSNYEIGWKTTWLAGHLRWNGALFHEYWKDIQITLPGQNGQNYLLNAGSAIVDGVETDVGYYTGGFNFNWSSALINARTNAYFCTSVCTPPDTQLPATPHFKTNATARYEWRDAKLKPYIQATASHQSGTRAALLDNFVNDTQNYLGETVKLFGYTQAFTTFDFAAGLWINDIKIEAFINNAFDSRGILSKQAACGLVECRQNARVYPTKPQLFGLKISQKF